MWWGKSENNEPVRRSIPGLVEVVNRPCCGCDNHAMEQRAHPAGYIGWWCFTCNAWQTGCKG